MTAALFARACHFPKSPHIGSHVKTVSMTSEIRRIAFVSVLLVFLGSGVGERVGCAKDAELPSDFYIVSMVTSDASPFWYHYVLAVSAEGRDSIVRYIRIAQIPNFCQAVLMADFTRSVSQ
jgi:hypothetical protein